MVLGFDTIVLGSRALLTEKSDVLLAEEATPFGIVASPEFKLPGRFNTFEKSFSAGDMIVGGSPNSRTLTRGSGLAMYVNGSNVASATIAARGVFGIYFTGSTYCYVTGDVS